MGCWVLKVSTLRHSPLAPPKKALQICKPDSVPVSGSLPFIWADASRRGSALPTPLADLEEGRCASHTSSAEAERKVYMAFQPARFIRPPTCAGAPCALTARFHPYRRPLSLRRLFSVTLSVPRPLSRPHPLGGAVLCVVRTFLPAPKGQRRQSDLQCKTLQAVRMSLRRRCCGMGWHDFLVLQSAFLAEGFLYFCATLAPVSL